MEGKKRVRSWGPCVSPLFILQFCAPWEKEVAVTAFSQAQEQLLHLVLIKKRLDVKASGSLFQPFLHAELDTEVNI